MPKEYANCKTAPAVIVQVAFVHDDPAPVEMFQSLDLPWKNSLNRLGTMPAKGIISDAGTW
jgi:hypothetical protein